MKKLFLTLFLSAGFFLMSSNEMNAQLSGCFDLKGGTLHEVMGIPVCVCGSGLTCICATQVDCNENQK